ncbi:MAG: septum formation initiator family protein [Cyclobacteriaceae bacterium]
MRKLPPIFKNFFFVSSVLFLVWMFFINSMDVFSVLKLKGKLSELKDQKSYYLEKIETVKKERKALMNDQDLLEKFARENYLMKKSSEDVFIVEEN